MANSPSIEEQKREHDRIRQALSEADIPTEFQQPGLSLEPYEKRSGCDGIALLRETINQHTGGWTRSVFMVHDVQLKHGAKVCYLIARALVLKGNSVRVLTLPKMADKMQHEPRALEAIFNEDLDVAVLLGFNDTDLSDHSPYPAKLMHSLEWFLSTQLSQGKGFVLHSKGPLSGETQGWWSRSFAYRMNECKIVEVQV